MKMRTNLPAGYSQALLHFSGVGLPRTAAISFGMDQLGTVPDVGTICGTLISLWATHLDSQLSNSCTFTGVRVKAGPMETGPFADVGASNVGGNANAATSPAVCYLVRKVTGSGGKSGTGRMFVPGLADNEVDEAGKISTTRLTSLGTAWTAFFNALVTANIPMVLLHSYGDYTNSAGQPVHVEPKDPTPVTSLVIDGTVATQRRRQRR